MTFTALRTAALAALLAAGSAMAGWLPIDTITNRATSDITCQGNAHAVVEDTSGNIHVVWRGACAGTQQVWYSRLGIEADTWTTDTVISDSGPAVTDPAIAADSSGNILVVWTSGAKLRARRRLGASGQWEPVDSAAGSSGDSSVSVACDRLGVAHIVWLRDSVQRLVLHTEFDTSFRAGRDTVAGPTQNLGRPCVAASPWSDLIVAWDRPSLGYYDVVTRRRTDGVWRNTEVVSGTSRSSSPSVAYAQDSFRVVWVTQDREQQAISHRARGGSAWGETTLLSPYRRAKKSPSLAVASDGGIYATWSGSDLGAYQVYWTRRPAGGTWIQPETLTSSTANKERVSSSAGNGTATVAWSEESQTFLWQVRLRRYERLHDVGVTELISPVGMADSGTSMVPRATVANFGIRAKSFAVVFRIGIYYRDTAWVSGLAAGDTAEVVFAQWNPSARGSQPVACSTMLAGDHDRENDRCSDSVFVVVRDAACAGIVRPSGMVSRGLIRPQARFENRGTDTVGMQCWFEIAEAGERDYLDSARLDLAPGGDSAFDFRPWPARCGHFTGRAWSALVRDMRPENDTSSRDFVVPRVDAALREVVEPTGHIEARPVTPRIRVANLSEAAADVRVSCVALNEDSTPAYSGSAVAAGMPETTEAIVDLPVWNALPGTYRFVAWTELPDDGNPQNDSATIEVMVESLPSGRWTELAPIPAGPRGVPVRGGSGLAATPTDLFALKGSNTGEWYRYCPDADSWQAMSAVPAATDGRRAGRGAALTSGSDSLFLLRGMGTLDLLVYLPHADSWHAALPLPGGTRGVRFGSGLAFVPGRDTGKVFCLKGGGTREFLVYWCRQRQWHARRSLPPGQTGRGARRGSAIVALGSRVFCLLGLTNELFEYAHQGDSWIRRRPLPLVGRQGYLKRSRAGACLAADGTRFIYALKGGGCNELWRYDAAADDWTQLDDVPFGRDRRRVKAGAGIAVFAGSVWAIKGGGCNEFWRYAPEVTLSSSPRPDRAGLAAPGKPAAGFQPATVFAAGLQLPEDGAQVRVRDAGGRLVRREVGPGSLHGLAAGVYFVEYRSPAGRRVVKVQVLR